MFVTSIAGNGLGIVPGDQVIMSRNPGDGRLKCSFSFSCPSIAQQDVLGEYDRMHLSMPGNIIQWMFESVGTAFHL